MAEHSEILPKDTESSLVAVLSNYKQAVEDFALAVEFSTSSYELMIAKQKYLQSASGVIKDLSDICDIETLSKAATFFKSAALAYLDDSDRRAHYQGLDGRFTLSEDVSRFLKSRLKMRAYQAYGIWAFYSRELRYSIDLQASTLQFMLDISLELPIDAWDCAPCLSAGGNCMDCGYGRDHKICSHPGSTYEMLSWSSGYIIKSIRMGLAKTKTRSRNGYEGADPFSGESEELFLDPGENLHEDSGAIDLCDYS